MARKSQLEQKYIGDEPIISEKSTELDLIKAYNYYHYNYNQEDAKGFVLDFLKSRKVSKAQIKKAQKLNAHDLLTIGWNCRIMLQGGKLPDATRVKSLTKLQDLMNKVEVKEEEVVEKVVISIQERIENKASELIGDLEEELDKFYSDSKFTFDAGAWFAARGIKPAIAKYIATYYQPLKDEVYDALENPDADLKEAYAKYKRPVLKKYLEFINSILSAAEVAAVTVKGSRKPRKKKVKPASVLVSKLKYKVKDDELKLTSVNPVDIIGAQQLWVFNSKTRSLSKYDATGASGLSVKGSTIVGFDDKTSITKKVRKPGVTIPKILEGGKIVLRKLMEELKTTEKQATGRINKDTVLVRIVK